MGVVEDKTMILGTLWIRSCRSEKMAVFFSDQDITRMIQERKPLPDNYGSRILFRVKRGHKERELDVDGSEGGKYRIILRQSNINTLDFSIILAVTPSGSNQPFRLLRCNGKSHEHTNLIEADTFDGFHIHKATERYQDLGANEEAFAEPTNCYSDFYSALRCFLEICCFEPPNNSQTTLFGRFDL